MRVIKIGGRAQDDPRLPSALAMLCREEPGELCVVHGGGDQISALQRTLGGAPTFVGGRRVTTREDVNIVRMVLSGSVNKRLVSALVSHGVPAVGISGEDAGMFSARAVDGEALGRVGRVEHVDTSLIVRLLGGGFVPVISPLARDLRGGAGDALNVNGDDAAAALAAALDADELLFLADVEGVLKDGELLASMDIVQAGELISNGVASDGMAAKLEAAMAALAGGVRQVRIGALGALHDASRGTTIVPSPTPVYA